VVLAPSRVEAADRGLGDVEQACEVAGLAEDVDRRHDGEYDAEAVDGPPLAHGREEVGVDGLAAAGLHQQHGAGEDRATGLRRRRALEVEAAHRTVPVTELVGGQAAEQPALLAPRRPLAVEPPGHRGPTVVDRQRAR
jgi:hypothetical protein